MIISRSFLLSSLTMALFISASALNNTNEDLITAMQEMQRSSYFTFVTLLNMEKDRLPPNATFLMPSDRALSKALIPENKTLEFLLRHSISSPLLFEDMLKFPTGTLVPTHQQAYMVKIVNRGRREFYLNNAQLVTTDVCTAGTSFRCHGIYGVLNMTVEVEEPLPNCSERTPPADNVASSPVSPAPRMTNHASSNATSSNRLNQQVFITVILYMVLSVIKLPF